MNDRNTDRIVGHSLLVLGISHLASVTSLAFHFVMGRMLPKEEYGVLVPMLGIILAFYTPMVALQNTVAHLTVGLGGSGRIGDVRRAVFAWSGRIAVFAVPLLILTLIFRADIASSLHLDSSLPLVFAALSTFVALFIPVLAGALQGLQAFAWMSLCSGGWQIARFVFGAAAVFFLWATASSALMAQWFGLLLSALVGMIGLSLYCRGAKSSVEPVENADRYFLFSLAALFSYSVLMYADMIMVKHFFPAPEDYGNYSRASAIGRMLVFLPQPIAGALFPKVVAGELEQAGHVKTLGKALLIGCIVTVIPLIVCLALPNTALLLMYKDAAPAPEMTALLRFICTGMSPLGLSFILLNYELARRRFECLWLLAGCAAALFAGIMIFHGSLWTVASILAAANIVAFIGLAALSFRDGVRRAAA